MAEGTVRLPHRRNVLAAYRRIRSHLHLTPVLHSPSLNAQLGFAVFFKCENLQRSGSFKFRGAMNAVLRLNAAQRRQGVVTHSSGNHGAALAAVARQLGVPATIVVPRGASRVKRAAIRRYGAAIVNCGPTLAARQRALERTQAATGAHFIPPYDHAAVIAGQGTAALELAAQIAGIEEIWVPVGGGGLAAGTLLAAPEKTRVVGAEPELAGDAAASLACGVRQPPMPPVTVADGLRTALGGLNFRLLSRYGLPIHLVTESEIIAAQRLVMSCLKVIVEPSSAVPIAALMKHGPQKRSSRRVAVIVTGGNQEV